MSHFEQPCGEKVGMADGGRTLGEEEEDRLSDVFGETGRLGAARQRR